ncbi:tyrosine-type recombinase/integrase [Methylobacterium radiodurans]|uniref:tyrosine-type recombinase/integrase n=1 Tax=Methylobacterium radiodurans TaxID=2202828 RepID=UPI001FE448DC|nr:tyrosine-type recombinase/integrase [Methylobacterium radiodurans]
MFDLVLKRIAKSGRPPQGQHLAFGTYCALWAGPDAEALFAPVRRNQVVRNIDRLLPWSAYDGRAISLRQRKGKRHVYVPVTRALKAALDAAPRRGVMILLAPDGAPWPKRSFHEVWSDTHKAAGIVDDLHFHDLRGTAVTMLAEAGCSVPEIATITGHSQAHAQKILDRYLARTLAESAIAKLDEHHRNRNTYDS